MPEMIDAIKAFLEESGFKYDFKEDIPCFDFGLNVDNGAVNVRIVARQQEEYFMLYAMWEGKMPVRSVPVVLPLINEINYNTKFTTLTVDPKDGELVAHCGFNTDDSGLSPKQVGIALQMTVRVLDDNIERLMRAAWSAPANSDGKYN